MTEQEIRDNAPDGATHYLSGDYHTTYYKVDGNNIYSWQSHNKKWHYDSIFHNAMIKPLP